VRITENKLRRIIRDVINQEINESNSIYQQRFSNNEDQNVNDEEANTSYAERKCEKLKAASKNSFRRAYDGRKVFKYEGEYYCEDTMLPMYVFDGMTLSQHFKSILGKIKDYFN